MPVPLTYIQCHHSHARLSQKSTLKGCSLSHQGSREEKSKFFFSFFDSTTRMQMSITWIPSPAMALPMDIHQHPDCPSVFQPTLDSGDCPSSLKTGFHAVPQMPMPWISNGYPFQSTLKTGFHTVPVCLRSKTALGFHAVPVYPGTPMPCISNGYPWICRLS